MLMQLNTMDCVPLTSAGKPLNSVLLGVQWKSQCSDLDLDLYSVLLDDEGVIYKKFYGRYDVAFYNQPTDRHKCVTLLEDSALTGWTQECMRVDFTCLPQNYNRIVFGLCVYQAAERKQTLAMGSDLDLWLTNAGTGEPLCTYSYRKDYDKQCSLLIGEMNKQDDIWNFKISGEASEEYLIPILVEQYGLPRLWYK